MSSNEAGAQAPAVVTVRFLTATGPYMPRDIAAFPRDIVDVYLKRGRRRSTAPMPRRPPKLHTPNRRRRPAASGPTQCQHLRGRDDPG